jgi:hypothetical protein
MRSLGSLTGNRHTTHITQHTNESISMTSSVVSDRITVTLAEAADLIVSCPENRFLLQGEPGTGKTSLAEVIRQRTGFYTAVLDCGAMDIGDAAIPMPVNDTKTLEYYLNSVLGLHTGEPVALFLDELTKAPAPVFGMFHPLLESYNPRMGNRLLPKGSIIVMTGNLDSDGVGDSLLAHSKMRVTKLEISKPTVPEWLPWAADNNIHPIVMAWADRNRDCAASYRDGGQDNNPYIFLPNKVQGAVWTWRSAERCSNLIWQRDKFSANALLAAMSGTVGAAAATSLSAFIRHSDSLTPWKEIMDAPTTAAIPEHQGALAVMVFSALERIQNKEELTSFMTYIKRADPEWQCVFCIALAKHQKKQSMAFTCKPFTVWCAENEDLL